MRQALLTGSRNVPSAGIETQSLFIIVMHDCLPLLQFHRDMPSLKIWHCLMDVSDELEFIQYMGSGSLLHIVMLIVQCRIWGGICLKAT